MKFDQYMAICKQKNATMFLCPVLFCAPGEIFTYSQVFFLEISPGLSTRARHRAMEVKSYCTT